MLRGQVPTRHWFMSRLCRFFPKEIASHSMRSGSTTSLAEAGADLTTIQAVGRWSSDTFRIYIQKNPVLIHAVLFGCPAHQPLNCFASSFLLFSLFFLRITPSLHSFSFLSCSTFFLSFFTFFLFIAYSVCTLKKLKYFGLHGGLRPPLELLLATFRLSIRSRLDFPIV